MAAVNGLPATWVELPPSLASLSVEEAEALARPRPSSPWWTGFRWDRRGGVGPTKTLFLPQARAQSVPTSRLVLAGTGRNVLALHSRPPSLPTPAN